MPQRRAWVLSITLLGALLSTPALAEWPSDPTQGVPLDPAGGQSVGAASCSDGAGGIVVVWQQLSPTSALRARRIGPEGEALWGSNGIALCPITTTAANPQMVSDNHGGYVVVWIDDRAGGRDVYAQRLNSSGTPLWDPGGVPVCTATSYQSLPVLVARADGGAVIAWWDYRNLSSDVWAQAVNGNGQTLWATNGVPVAVLPDDQDNPKIAGDGQDGAYLTWRSPAGNNFALYAQHLNSAGSPLWVANGVLVASATGSNPAVYTITADGSGGMLELWTDLSNISVGSWCDLRLQHFRGDGSVQWPQNGVAIGQTPECEEFGQLAADGAGGFMCALARATHSNSLQLVAERLDTLANSLFQPADKLIASEAGPIYSGPELSLQDVGGGRFLTLWCTPALGNSDIFAQEMDTTGVMLWNSGGVPVTTAPSAQNGASGSPDGDGGAFIVWSDYRGIERTFVQRVNRLGLLAGDEPVVRAVSDVPNDQGGRVELDWWPSPRDRSNGAVLRYVVLSNDGAGWVARDSIPATGLSAYSVVLDAPTCDAADTTTVQYTVDVVMADGSSRWRAQPARGCALDNLAPSTPVPVRAVRAGNQVSLVWTKPHEPDFDHFKLYRSKAPDGAEPYSLLTALTDSTYDAIDSSATGFRVSAVDTHANESQAATLVLQDVTAVPTARGPWSLALAPVVPNPATGRIESRITLPEPGEYVLEVIDAFGRRVLPTRSGRLEPGVHVMSWTMTDGLDRLASGLYWIRLKANGTAIAQRFVVLR